MIIRNSQPDVIGTPAIFCAIITPNGLVPAQAQPMPYGTQIMPIATIASIRIARLILTMIGMSGTYSSPMPIVNAPMLKISRQPPINTQGLAPRRSTALCRAASMAPVSRRILMTPPEIKIRKIMSSAAAKPLGIATRKCQGGKVTASSSPA